MMEQQQNLSKRQRRKLRQQENEQINDKGKRRNNIMKWLSWSATIIVLVAAGYGITRSLPERTALPPTTMAGHIEKSPESHIAEEPMLLAVHKHMLEHADGEGPPGVIINYNCIDFSCDTDLIDKLSVFVEDNPEFVYLAPFKDLSNKIVVTKLGEQITLDEYDEEAINDFI